MVCRSLRGLREKKKSSNEGLRKRSHLVTEAQYMRLQPHLKAKTAKKEFKRELKQQTERLVDTDDEPMEYVCVYCKSTFEGVSAHFPNIRLLGFASHPKVEMMGQRLEPIRFD